MTCRTVERRCSGRPRNGWKARPVTPASVLVEQGSQEAIGQVREVERVPVQHVDVVARGRRQEKTGRRCRFGAEVFEVAGLLALMLLTEARRTARVPTSGGLVTIDQQDRGACPSAIGAPVAGHRVDAV
ncbi:DUF6596 domain-containing protein, partial [Streptomyces sp. NPDC055078]